MILLLPVFFVVAGLKVDVHGLGARRRLELLLILVAAVVGKFVGAAGRRRVQRLPRRAGRGDRHC